MSDNDEIREAQLSIVEATGSQLGAVSDIGGRPPHWYWRRAARAWEARAVNAEHLLQTFFPSADAARQVEEMRAAIKKAGEAAKEMRLARVREH